MKVGRRDGKAWTVMQPPFWGTSTVRRQCPNINRRGRATFTVYCFSRIMAFTTYTGSCLLHCFLQHHLQQRRKPRRTCDNPPCWQIVIVLSIVCIKNPESVSLRAHITDSSFLVHTIERTITICQQGGLPAQWCHTFGGVCGVAKGNAGGNSTGADSLEMEK